MNRVEEWVPFSWHYVNCGNIVTGFRNSRGDIKVECKRCKTAMIRTLKTSKHDILKVYAPEGMERIQKNSDTGEQTVWRHCA